MSQINSEALFSSTAANSSLQQRTFDYAFSNVDQNAPYSFSEFHGKTYSGAPNAATLYYYYPYDGGNGYNNPQIWGWASSAAAETHVGLYQDWTHTVYFSGSIANGTRLWIDADPADGRYAQMIDQGQVNPPYTGAWYFITNGTTNWVCQASTSTPTFTISSLTAVSVNLGWSFLQNAASGNLLIEKNSSTVVNQSGNNSGTFSVQTYDSVDGTVSGTASYPLLIQASIQGFANGSYYYYDSTNYSSASVNHFFTIGSLTDTYSVEGETYQY